MKQIVRKVLFELSRLQRVSATAKSCSISTCPICFESYSVKILRAIEKNLPIQFVLPAFPGKSPNLEKVLGHLPDLAEQVAINQLVQLAANIKKFYAPGIKICIASDGRVFSDVVGMKEDHVTDYQESIKKMIAATKSNTLSHFDLNDVYQHVDFKKMRQLLIAHFGESIEDLKKKIKNDLSANSLYCGITRFLFEDALYSGQSLSRTAIQKRARQKAYSVIQRSNAWSRLLAHHFPDAVRLSIHPQQCGSQKIGLRLIEQESWMTPWHGVLVEKNNQYQLMKRFEAEQLGAALVFDKSGLPSHFKITTSNSESVSCL